MELPTHKDIFKHLKSAEECHCQKIEWNPCVKNAPPIKGGAYKKRSLNVFWKSCNTANRIPYPKKCGFIIA